MATSLERSAIQYGRKTIAYSIRRSERRGTLSIAVDSTGDVLVTAPAPTTRTRIDDVVHAKASWIVARQKRASDLPPPVRREFVSGETFFYLGRQYRLRVDVDEAPKPMRLAHGWLRVPVPKHLGEENRQSFVRAALIDWYKARAKERLRKIVAEWSVRIGVRVPDLKIVEQERRWGSASSSGVVRLNWRVLQAPPVLLEYVVAHELVHLKHADHSPAFWALLEEYGVQVDRCRRELRERGATLVW